jgi:hypothetical protein
MAIGAPISYYLSSSILDMAYEYRIPMDIYGVVGSVVLLMFVLLGTVSTQVRKVFRSNPVEGLKIE